VTDSVQASKRSKRSDHVLATKKESMREKISFGITIKTIEEIEVSLKCLAEGEADPSTARIGAYKALLDSKWRKIDKLLPSMKAVELSGSLEAQVKVKDLT